MPLNSVLLSLLLLLSGGYAGILLFCVVALAPGLRRLPARQFAETFRALDRLMAARMPAYKVALLLLYLANLGLRWPQLRTLFWHGLLLSFVLTLADLAINVGRQLALNQRIQTFPPEAAERELVSLRDQTFRFFQIRFLLSGLAFALLCFTAVLPHP